MKKIFISLTLISVVLVLIMTTNDKETIIVYASTEQFRNDEMQVQLNNKFPNLKIRVMYTPTAKAAAKLSIEKENTDADIIVGLESSYLSKITGSLADISGLSKLDYLDDLKPELFNNKFIIWERQAGTFVVNREVLDKKGLEVPTSYDDLLKPEYKDLIAMPDPKSSGTGYFFYLNRVNELGEEKALEYFDKLYANVKQFTESGSGPIKLLNQGEVAVGLGLTFQSVNQINKGLPFEIIYPEQGSPYSLTGTALVTGRENDENILDVFDFLINDFILYDKENFSPEQIFSSQKNIIPNYPQNIQYADMTGIDSIAEKERLLELWKY